VSSTVSFGRKVVAPLLTGFQSQYPEIAVDLLLDDNLTDCNSEQVDIAFCDGRPEQGQLIAKQLFPMQLLLCASPAYAAKHGLPSRIEELGEHHCVNYRLGSGRISEWDFKVDGKPKKFSPKGKSSFNDADLVLHAVLEGQGIAQLPGYQVGDLLARGQLTTCLAANAPDDRGHYLCYPSRQHLPARVRVYIDYMSGRVRGLLESSMAIIHDLPTAKAGAR